MGQAAQGTAGIIGVRCLPQNQPIYTYVHVCVGMNARLCAPGCPFATRPEGKWTLRLIQPDPTCFLMDAVLLEEGGRTWSGAERRHTGTTRLWGACISPCKISLTPPGRITGRRRRARGKPFRGDGKENDFHSHTSNPIRLFNI